MLDDAAWAQDRLFGGQIRHYDVHAARVSESLLSVTWRDITAQVEARREIEEQTTKEQQRLTELEQFQRLTVGRELKMIELKQEIEDLRKSGSPDAGDSADGFSHARSADRWRTRR
jgi:hypothetical protein